LTAVFLCSTGQSVLRTRAASSVQPVAHTCRYATTCRAVFVMTVVVPTTTAKLIAKEPISALTSAPGAGLADILPVWSRHQLTRPWEEIHV